MSRFRRAKHGIDNKVKSVQREIRVAREKRAKKVRAVQQNCAETKTWFVNSAQQQLIMVREKCTKNIVIAHEQCAKTNHDVA